MNMTPHIFKTSISSSTLLWLGVFGSSLLLTGCGGDSVSVGSEPVAQTDNSQTDNSQDDTGQDDSAQNDGSDNDNTDDQAASQGKVMFAITDAEEDFLSYSVDINSVVFTKQNGDQIEILPGATDVDFVNYQELTELFSILSVPVGRYESISLVLDYSDSDIVIQDELGNSYSAAVQDADGNAISTYQVDLQLEADAPLIVTANRFSLLTLDLDLSATNTVLSYEPAIVEVAPVVIANTSLDEDREHRVRGQVEEVVTQSDVAATLTLDLKPMRERDGQFGQFDVQLSTETLFELDGVNTDFTAALEQLDSLSGSEPVVVFCQLKTIEESETGEVEFVAERVLSGSSLPWAGFDGVKGMITEVLVPSEVENVSSYRISGIALDDTAPHINILKQELFSVSDATKLITMHGRAITQDYLVPGQKLKAVGQLETDRETETLEFNASTEGDVVRLLPSSLRGQVTSVSETGVVTMEARRINKRPIGMLERIRRWVLGRGMTHEVTLDVSQLDVLTLATGDWISVHGYLNPEDKTTDMLALSVTKHSLDDGQVKYLGHWGEAGAEVTVSENNDAITLDVSTGRQLMKFRFFTDNVMPEVSTLTLNSAEHTRHFVLHQAGNENQHFESLTELLAQFKVEQENGAVLTSVLASGQYDEESNTYSATSVIFKVN